MSAFALFNLPRGMEAALIAMDPYASASASTAPTNARKATNLPPPAIIADTEGHACATCARPLSGRCGFCESPDVFVCDACCRVCDGCAKAACDGCQAARFTACDLCAYVSCDECRMQPGVSCRGGKLGAQEAAFCKAVGKLPSAGVAQCRSAHRWFQSAPPPAVRSHGLASAGCCQHNPPHATSTPVALTTPDEEVADDGRSTHAWCWCKSGRQRDVGARRWGARGGAPPLRALLWFGSNRIGAAATFSPAQPSPAHQHTHTTSHPTSHPHNPPTGLSAPSATRPSPLRTPPCVRHP